MDFRLSDEQRRMVDTLRKFRRDVLEPNAITYLDGTFPHENMARLAELGILGMAVPQEYGGSGLGVLDTVLALEEIGKACYVTAMAALGEVGVQTRIISTFAPESLKRRYLPAIAEGKCILSICMTEPHAGTDVPAYRTNAEITGDRAVLKGTKTLISRADVADLFVVFTRVNGVPGAPGIGCALVPKGAPGLSSKAAFHTMGGEYLCEVLFEDCEIPAENVILKADGMKKLLQRLQYAAVPERVDLPRPGRGGDRGIGEVPAPARGLRPSHRGLPGLAVEGGRHVHRRRGGAGAALPGRGERRRVPRPGAGRDGEDLLQ